MKRYGITLAADLYTPKIIKGKLTGLAVGSPYEAVKEQAGGIYAMKMAERGYVTLAFDPSFNGESGGNVRLVSSPDINTEDFCASVDWLVCLENVDPEKIGIIGICGFGGLVISAAAMDQHYTLTMWMSFTRFQKKTNTFQWYFSMAMVNQEWDGWLHQMEEKGGQIYFSEKAIVCF